MKVRHQCRTRHLQHMSHNSQVRRAAVSAPYHECVTCIVCTATSIIGCRQTVTYCSTPPVICPAVINFVRFDLLLRWRTFAVHVFELGKLR